MRVRAWPVDTTHRSVSKLLQRQRFRPSWVPCSTSAVSQAAADGLCRTQWKQYPDRCSQDGRCARLGDVPAKRLVKVGYRLIAAIATAIIVCGAAQAQIILKASHQFQAGKG